MTKARGGKLIDDENKIIDASHIVTSSRASDTVYRNTSNRALLVLIDVMTHLEDATGGASYFNDKRVHIGETEAVVTARTNMVSKMRPEAVLGAGVDAEFSNTLAFVVPPDWYYELESFDNSGDTNAFTINSWKEYEL